MDMTKREVFIMYYFYKLILKLLRIFHLTTILSDEKYLKMNYYVLMKQKLNLKNPQTFNEKLQWLKLNDRKKEYTTVVDKYEAKKYISNIIGERYIIPTLGIYNKFDDINFDELPNQFVIKCTHDSGGIIIVKDKDKLDISKAKKIITKSLKNNYYLNGREWPYKNVAPRIIIEQYMSNNGQELEDYKIHNFNGESKIILVCKDRYKETGLTEDFFDVKWNNLGIKRPSHSNSNEKIKKPQQLNEMIELSKKISQGIPFVRTDFYVIDNKVFFGEVTFYPASGFEKFIPNEWDLKLGNWIKLPKK